MPHTLNIAQKREQFLAKELNNIAVFFSIRSQACPNSSCTHFAKLCGGNVTVHSRRYQRFMCKLCKKTWVAHRQDLTYRLHAEPRTLHMSMLLSRQGESVRNIARILHVSPSTVQRWKAKELQVMVH